MQFLFFFSDLGVQQNQFSWSCCLRKCVSHMYIEVEPGLIAIHTQPEDITMWTATIAIFPWRKLRFDSLGLRLCEDVIHQSTQTEWGHLCKPEK